MARRGTHRHSSRPPLARRCSQGRRTSAVSPGVWTHVFVTYDGSARGVRREDSISTDEPQETDVQADVLKQTIRTQVPLKVGQRHTGSRIDRLGGPLPAHLRPGPLTARGRDARWCSSCGRTLAITGRTSGRRPKQDAVFAWWRAYPRPRFPALRATSCWQPRGRRGRHQETRHVTHM